MHDSNVILVKCREEIKRLKAENPKMAHKEAFSTAAKNVRLLNCIVTCGEEMYLKRNSEYVYVFGDFQWANFPPSQCKGEADSCKLVDLDCHVESFNAPEVNII